MELDLQRFYKLNRRALMWAAFFGIVYLLREFFALIFLTFIFGFVMNKVAVFITRNTRLPYRPAVVLPYILTIAILSILIQYTVPRVTREGAEFAKKMPHQLMSLSLEIHKLASSYDLEHALVRYAHLDTEAQEPPPQTAVSPAPEGIPAEQWAELTLEQKAQVKGLAEEMQRTALSLLTGFVGEGEDHKLQDAIFDLTGKMFTGTIQFLLAVLLSILILWDFDRIAHELTTWQNSSVGKFFAEASSSVIDFSRVVGSAFQCQLVIAFLNASITSVGLLILGVKPVVLLTTIVFLLGLIPVLGVFISSVPIILISFNTFGLNHTFLTLGMIVCVHMLEAYVFNPRIYAARFHLNPVVVLIILLVAHEVAGVWGMLLGIPVTHYVLNIAQMPTSRRRRRKLRQFISKRKDPECEFDDPDTTTEPS